MSPLVSRALRPLALSAALLFALMFFATALPRVAYPYDLDFIEDSMMMQAWRFAQGQPIYLAPNADFNPHVYMPLHTLLSGIILKVTGLALAPLRLLSLVATLGTAGLIFWIARRESGETWLGWLCAGLYLGGYRLTGFWYDLVRVDALFVLCSLGALAASFYARTTRHLLLAAVLTALAFFAKQSGLLIGVGVGGWLWWRFGHRVLLFGITYLVLVALPLSVLYILTDGWFFLHTFEIASSNPTELGRILHYVWAELGGGMLGLSLMALAGLFHEARSARWALLQAQPWWLGIGLAAVISGTVRASVGGNLNNLMLVYALLCLAPALLFKVWPRAEPALLALAIAQFALGVYYPPRYIPTVAMRASGDQLIQRIANTEGHVLTLMHPYYTWLAGKEPATQLATLWYVRGRGTHPLPADFAQRIEQQYYSTIISDESFFEQEPVFHNLLNAYYTPVETLPESLSPLAPVGMPVRPQIIYRPRQP